MVRCGYGDYMETHTYKPIKIEAGRYIYRDVAITKMKKSGFCATAVMTHGSIWLGRYTLARCITEIDKWIGEGYVIDRKKLYNPEYHAKYIANRNA